MKKKAPRSPRSNSPEPKAAPALLRGRVHGEGLVVLARELAALLQAGLPLSEALQIVSDRPDEPRLAAALEQARLQVLEGRAISDACASIPTCFDGPWCSMLRLGESSGDLAGPLLAGAEQRERLETLRRRLLQAAAYPALLSLVLLALGALLAFFVLPRFAALYKSMGSDLPWLTRALLAVLHGLPWLLAVLLASAGLAWLWAARQGPAALRLRLHALILRLPLVGPLATEMLWGRAAGALRAQLAAGERVTQALRLAAEGAGNLQLAARLSATAQAVAEGSAVSAALHEAGAPAVLTKLARVGERSGDLAGLCGQAAVLLESRFERRLTRYSAMVEPVMILVAGLVVGVVVVALYLPIFQMGTLLR